jgi:replicative DNA helicase
MVKTAEEIQQEIQRRRDVGGVGSVPQGSEVATPTPSPGRRGFKYIHPFADAAEGLIEYAQNPEGRFMLGLHDIDVMTRGFGRKELAYVTGRAHSGKTQVVLQSIANNPDRRIIFFTPDETSELILSKLVAMTHEIDAETIEARIKAGDPDAIEIVRKTAAHDYRNLIVIDESLSMGQMFEAVREAEAYWDAQVDVVVVDFLELIPSGDDGHDGVVAKSQAMKRFAHDIDAPVICLHQASRSSGTRGQAAGMGAMRYGGETEAIFVLEVFRRKEDRELDEWERLDHADTVTVNVAKNKRPPCKKGEVDLFLDPQTGRVKPIAPTIKREAPVQQEPRPNPVQTWQDRELSF